MPVTGCGESPPAPQAPPNRAPLSDALQECLEATFFLDWRHPSVTAFAAETCARARDDQERAAALFLAVRDRIRYDPYSCAINPDRFRASSTLARGHSFCVPKAILLAAAARSVGIPARLGFADVRNHLATRRLLDLMRTDRFVFHGFAELRVEGRWRKAAPSFDRGLCERFGVPPLDFDGRGDALLQTFDARGRLQLEVLTDRGRFTDFPHGEFVRAFRAHYPHLFDARGNFLPRRAADGSRSDG